MREIVSHNINQPEHVNRELCKSPVAVRALEIKFMAFRGKLCSRAGARERDRERFLRKWIG